jgi:hypothetical protein
MFRRGFSIREFIIPFLAGVFFAVWGSVWAASSPLSFDFFFALMIFLFGGFLIIIMFMLLFNSKIIAACVSLVTLLVVAGVSIVSVYREYFYYKDYLDIAHLVCIGHGTNRVSTYTEVQGSHPVVIASRNILGYRKWSPHNDSLPLKLRPDSASDIQLILCIDSSEDDLIEYCDYHGYKAPRSVSRYVSVLSMRLVNAKTGATIQSVELRGGIPDECPPSSSVLEGQTLEYKGDPVSTAAIIHWLSQYVEP